VPHIELAGNDIGNQALAVFADKGDFASSALQDSIQFSELVPEVLRNL
jgi:hypothetical protein